MIFLGLSYFHNFPPAPIFDKVSHITVGTQINTVQKVYTIYILHIVYIVHYSKLFKICADSNTGQILRKRAVIDLRPNGVYLKKDIFC